MFRDQFGLFTERTDVTNESMVSAVNEVGAVGCVGPAIPFTGEDATAADSLKAKSDAANAGEEIDKTELRRRARGKASVCQLTHPVHNELWHWRLTVSVTADLFPGVVQLLLDGVRVKTRPIKKYSETSLSVHLRTPYGSTAGILETKWHDLSQIGKYICSYFVLITTLYARGFLGTLLRYRWRCFVEPRCLGPANHPVARRKNMKAFAARGPEDQEPSVGKSIRRARKLHGLVADYLYTGSYRCISEKALKLKRSLHHCKLTLRQSHVRKWIITVRQ